MVKRTQIQLTEVQASRLQSLAAERHVSVASLIRDSVDNLLEYEYAVPREELIKRSLEVAGRFHSEKGDISEHHDDYLAEAYGEHKE